jgi:hypothetical protein
LRSLRKRRERGARRRRARTKIKARTVYLQEGSRKWKVKKTKAKMSQRF